MKNASKAVINCTNDHGVKPNRSYKHTKRSSFFLAALFTTFLFAACNKQDLNRAGRSTLTDTNELSSETDFLNSCKGLSAKTLKELQDARQATERYKDINNAFADGYIDINVVMPNMGYHFEKPSLADSVFDPKHPELLVYNKTVDGSFKLVAIEYAIPLDKSANAPKGFAGSKDVWDHNTGFGLWLLHAWVWKFNPDGVFNPTNPDVHVR
jgi:hypothetical protein